MPRTILVHLNVRLPDDARADSAEIAEQVEGALEVGTDEKQTPDLYVASITISSEEI